MTKTTGLAAALGQTKAKTAEKGAATPVATAPAKSVAEKGVVFRLSPGDWKRLKELALDRETTLQQLLEDGVNKVLAERGLAPIGTSRKKRA